MYKRQARQNSPIAPLDIYIQEENKADPIALIYAQEDFGLAQHTCTPGGETSAIAVIYIQEELVEGGSAIGPLIIYVQEDMRS